MQESSYATDGSHPSAHGAPAAASGRGLASADRVKVRELLNRRRELTDLVAVELRENEVLRAQVERTAAELDAGSDASATSQALRKHAQNVRRLHEEMRASTLRERSTERKLRQTVSVFSSDDVDHSIC